MDPPPGLLADRGHHARMAVPDVVDRDARQEVEVLVALGVAQDAPGAGYELDRVTRGGGRQRHDAGLTFVPIPASVNSSSSSECGRRPSMMCANVTPPWIASTHACSFGRMPPSIEAIAAWTWSAPRSEMTDSGSAGSRSQPGTSVRKITL